MKSDSTEELKTVQKVQSFSYILKTLFAGGVSGCCAKTAIAPLDRIKILFQASNPHYLEYSRSFRGLIGALGNVSTTEGLKGHFKGNSATIARIFPYAALQYMSFEQFKVLLIDVPNRSFFAGALAGTVSVLGTYPLDLARAKLAFQVKVNKYDGLWDTLSKTFKYEGGVAGLYRGFGPTLMGIIPYAGVSFFCYDTLKNTYKKKTGSDSLPIVFRLGIGGLAGALAQTASYPLDVIRRRMQVEGHFQTNIYTSTWTSFKYILKNEGIRGLYVGLYINYLKVAPAVGISFATYEYLKGKLGVA